MLSGARCSGGHLALLVTSLPFLRSTAITEFRSDMDLVDVAMASSHIPGVCDPRLWVNCRWRPVVDGGLWWLLKRSTAEYMPRHVQRTLLITPLQDPNILQVSC